MAASAGRRFPLSDNRSAKDHGGGGVGALLLGGPVGQARLREDRVPRQHHFSVDLKMR